ncbi:MAG: hypothetical protein E7629_06105 [Ruminococcaceae bacterium]|nr:hypothetical protein [Oscillospiraceae bacterium]
MKKSFFYIILAGVLWGTSGIFVHYLAPHGFTSLQMTAVRGCVSFLCLALYAFFFDKKLFRVTRPQLILCICMGISLLGTAGGYFASMQMTSVSTAVVLMYSAPIYVTIFSVLFLKERMSRGKLTALILMILGCALVSGIVGGLKFDPLGIFLGIVSGISYAAYNIFTKIVTGKGCKPMTATLYSSLFMALIALCISNPKGIAVGAMQKPALLIPMLLCLGVITFVLPYVLYSSAIKVLPAGTASALSIVEPMAATLFSVFLFDEKLTFYSCSGIVLILAAVLLLGKTDGKRKDT